MWGFRGAGSGVCPRGGGGRCASVGGEWHERSCRRLETTEPAEAMHPMDADQMGEDAAQKDTPASCEGMEPTKSMGLKYEAMGEEAMGAFRCRANMAHIRQSRPDSGLGFQVNLLHCFLFARKRSMVKDTYIDTRTAAPPPPPNVWLHAIGFVSR